MYVQAIQLYVISEQMNILPQLVCSKVRAEIFRILFGLDEKEMHLREISRRAGLAVATVQQDLAKLVELGLVVRRQDGNRVCYRADVNNPLYADIRQLVWKTAGMAGILEELMDDEGIQCAFVFGPAANGLSEEGCIDLMIIGNIGLRVVSSLLSGAEERLGREINPHILSEEEFKKLLSAKDPFLSSVISSSKIFFVGSQQDLL